MAEATRDTTAMMAKRHAFFALFLFASAGFFWKTLSELTFYSLHDESCSHVVLIPFVSLYLIYLDRSRIFSRAWSSIRLGATLVLAGTLIYWLVGRYGFGGVGKQQLFLSTLLLIGTWVGGFLACYGMGALRAAAFPFSFLLLMLPLPDGALAQTIRAMQEGSTDVVVVVLKAAGVPVLRQGFVLSMPGLAIEIAAECSGIRSSIALFITAILAAHICLRTTWKRILFVALTLPLAIVKNGIRVATLTLLSIHVDPSFLTGRLHREGGFVFFFLALAVLWPVLRLLQRSEVHRGRGRGQGASGHAVTGAVRA